MRTGRAVALVTAAALLGDTLLYSTLPVNAARLGLDALTVGLALSLNRWIRLLTNPLAARLYERFRAGPLVPVALGLAVVSTAIYALPAVVVVFLGARLVWGAAWSLLRLGALLSAIDGSGGRAGRALGEMRAVYGLGYLGGALYAPFAVEAFGWQAAALGTAVLTLVLGIAPALRVSGWTRSVEAVERSERAVWRALWEPRHLGLFAIAAAQYAVYSGVLTVAGGLRVAEIFPRGSAIVAIPVAATVVAGLYILAQRLAQVVWTPFAGRLADRSVARTFVASTVIGTLATAALTLVADGTAFILVGACAFFAGITSVVAIELAIAHRTEPAEQPRIFGAYNTWADVGAAAGALAGGALALAGTSLAISLAAAGVALTLPVWWTAVSFDRPRTRAWEGNG